MAIFGSLGTLWVGGAVFIVVLYRWILRYERQQGPIAPDAVPVTAPPRPERAAPRMLPATATAREALAAQP
ncbi:MAG: hypothetical protein AB1Z98_02055 [Nannocystaceae bacterium]